MTESSENGVSTTTPKLRHRSPNYPSIGLRAAVGKIETLYKGTGLAPVMKITALKQMGYEKAEGDGARLLSALRNFGLVEEVGEDRLKLTQRGIDIVARQPSDPQRITALRESASGPNIYQELLTKYASGMPGDSALKSELIAAKKFNPNAVDGFIQDFKDTLEFAGISDVRVLESKHEEEVREPPPPPAATPGIGDRVQWESQGVLQFPEPRRIRAFSDDGQWVFVEGSSTGVPLRELTIVETPITDPKIQNPPQMQNPPQFDSLKPPPRQGAQPAPKMRSYSWALSGDFNAKLDLFGDAQTEEDIDALADYVNITIKALKRSLKAKPREGGE
jgi:hypothetical protein